MRTTPDPSHAHDYDIEPPHGDGSYRATLDSVDAVSGILSLCMSNTNLKHPAWEVVRVGHTTSACAAFIAA